jgi:hypothetical protein
VVERNLPEGWQWTQGKANTQCASGWTESMAIRVQVTRPVRKIRFSGQILRASSQKRRGFG